MKEDLSKLPMAALAIGETACTEMVAAQVGLWTFEQMKAAIQSSVYWSKFCELAKAGQIPENWLPGALGRAVLGWAKA